MRTPGSMRAARLAIFTLVACGFTSTAFAQEKPEPAGSPLPPYAQSRQLQDLRSPAERMDDIGGPRPIIMLTGYWPPTNEMMRHFSTNPEQNPSGWMGSNWEGLGYDIHAFFPEFPGGLGQGEGDFEVDYQDTSADFWPLVEQLRPIAIISFGRASADRDWRLEGGNYRYTLSSYSPDYQAPTRPTIGLPFSTEPAGTFRDSTLPITDIIDAMVLSGVNVDPSSTDYDTSKFLCSYMGYHTNWYHALHSDLSDPAWNATAGFIHLGSAMGLDDAMAGLDVTLRSTIDYIDSRHARVGDVNCDSETSVGDINAFVLLLVEPAAWMDAYPECPLRNGDINQDGAVDFGDINPFVELLAIR